jgi:peptidyl-prolyl cis-trans isomerase D
LLFNSGVFQKQHDSAKVRHILISIPSERNKDQKRTDAQSKSLADSLKKLLEKDRKRYDEFVEKYSDDPGKKKPDIKANPQLIMDKRMFPDPKDTNNYTGKGGNYGWVTENSQFVPEFKEFALKGKKGDLGVVKTDFGYHIMEVLDASKTTKTKYKVATITRQIQPSDATRNDFIQKASDFAGQNNTPEKFQKAVEAMKLNKRLHDDLKENDPYIPGFQNPEESPKELIREVYKAKAGDVLKPFTIGDRIVVALVSKVKERGATPLEFVKEDVTNKVRDEKKSEMIVKEFNGKGAKTIDELAAKTGLTIEKMDKLMFSAYAVPVYGREDELIGTATATKKGTMSKPGKGTAGVWVVQVENVNATPEIKDINELKKNYRNGYMQRIQQGEPNEALKKAAGIEDHKARFDY